MSARPSSKAKKRAPPASPRSTVLEQIAMATRRRVERDKARTPEGVLRAMVPYPGSGEMTAALAGPGLRVIAEVKLASPSEGTIALGLDPAEVARSYAANGAAAISVLTEPSFFSGKVAYLARVREAVRVPVLMKDFIIDEYQLLQARAHGADCVLLIVALLGREGLLRLGDAARELGLSTLVEVHDERELEEALACGARLIGVNNRDLRSLKVDLDVARRLAPVGVKAGAVLVCESGLSKRAQLEEMVALGYKGFLVGTHLMRSGRPGEALAALLGRKPA